VFPGDTPRKIPGLRTLVAWSSAVDALAELDA
jgi:hypothetical protein